MNRLKLFILIFLLTISLPLAVVVYRSYSGLKQEERAQMRFFSTTLVDRIEGELAQLVQTEEERAVDEYQHFLADSSGPGQRRLSPLAEAAYRSYILGYFQNNPDGSMQTPLVADPGDIPRGSEQTVDRLTRANEIFNSKKLNISKPVVSHRREAVEAEAPVQEKAAFAERYLRQVVPERKPVYLGKKTQRVEEITVEQARNVATVQKDKLYEESPVPAGRVSSKAAPAAETEIDDDAGLAPPPVSYFSRNRKGPAVAEPSPAVVPFKKFNVEVAPFQSVALQDDDVYIFRRIVINGQIYRQGFILLVEPLLQHLIDTHFAGQPLADFMTLSFRRGDQEQEREILRTAGGPAGQEFVINRRFPVPFDFLSLRLTSHSLPPSSARSTLNMALGVLGAFLFIGLITIYQSVRSIVSLSERRAQFVSSVTHELKTPLTNIRMYIEMLDQGIAGSPEKEREYLSILDSESARLSGLITNVLELARLEKKQRNFNFSSGNLDDVLAELQTVMGHKIGSEGFSLEVSKTEIPAFAYDRDVLLQILVNLIENSLKFGRNEPKREISVTVEAVDGSVRIAVADTGPGIPRHALKKIFTDFYRADNSAGGTGIGLALVKRFAVALGGSVSAANNDGPGCTITLVLPARRL